MGRGASSKAVPHGRLEMNDDKRIPIQDKATGAIRYSEPFRKNVPSDSSPSASLVNSTTPPGTENPAAVQQMLPVSVETIATPLASNEGSSSKGKPKQEISTLEQFLVQAYGLKGRRISIKNKILQNISQNLHIPVEGRVVLQRLANADKQFCVPRQILLAAREIEGYPAIKESLRSFVQDVMLSHPIFKNPKVVAVIRNLPEALPPHAALKLVMEEVVEKEDCDEKVGEKKDGEKAAKKAVDPEELKVNAANCLVVWLTLTKQLSLEEVTDALNDAIWIPAGRAVELDVAKLRELTGVSKPEGLGLACELYRRKAREQATLAEKISSEVNGLRSSLVEAQQQFELTNSQFLESQTALEKLQQESVEEINALHSSTETQAAHLRDDLEQLRSRVLRRLVADVESLDVGLSALQSPKPRIHVIQDRVERVIDALRLEISRLREG